MRVEGHLTGSQGSSMTHLAGTHAGSACCMPSTTLGGSLGGESGFPPPRPVPFALFMRKEERQLTRSTFYMQDIVVLFHFIGKEMEGQKCEVHVHSHAGRRW